MKITKTINFRTGAAPIALGLALLAGPAFAQTAEEGPVSDVAADAAAADENLIIVTGSRIPSLTLTSPSPLQIVSEAAIDQSGVVNLQEILLENPVFGTPTISRTNSNFSTSSAGVATVDLRNLDTARTLVLVNGRRFVSGVPGDQAVDLNTIPTQFIERVDVLTGGASAVYGSDAVAGVVNIIYKTDFEGIEANAQYGLSGESDDIRKQVNVTIGGNFNDGRGKIMAFAGYSEEGAVFSRDRDISAVDTASTGAFVTGDPADFFKATIPFFSSFAPQGRFFNAPGVTAGTFDRNNNYISGFSTNGTATRPADGFNRSGLRSIALPTERYLTAFNGSYEITNGVEAFIEATYAKTTTKTELEPFALDSFDLFPATGGFFNVENVDEAGNDFVSPFVPAGLLAELTDNDGDGFRDVAFTRRLSDVALRGNNANRDTFRVLGGLRGTLFDRFNWDVFYGYGSTTENQVSTGQFNVVNFRNALQITRDADGELVCLDAQAREEGCVPVNIFGRNTIDADGLRYINAPSFLSTEARQKLAGANIAGNLFDPFGQGEIGVAVGVEYRKEASRSEFDALQQAGLNGGNAIPSTFGEFDVYEAYGEVRVPVLRDTFIHDLTVTAAGRVADYSSVGRTDSFNVGVDFSPIEDIRFTAIWARSTRAPNVTELFSPPSQTFPTGLQDPCDGIGATGGGVLGDQCRSYSGVVANIAENGTFTLNQSDLQGISGFDRGNPALGAEKGDSFTARVIINPRSIDALRNFSFSASYFNIRIADAIVATPRQFILDQCFAAGNDALCAFITRRDTPQGSNSAGSLDEIDSAETNSGGVATEGIDFTLGYTQDLRDWGLGGRLSLNGSYTRLIDGFEIPLVGQPKDPFAGEIGASKDRFFVSANYQLDSFQFTARGTYIGEAFLDDQFLSSFDLEPESELGRVAPEFYLDIQSKFMINDTFDLYGGVDNLLANDPPFLPSGLPGNVTGTETDAGTYDAIGRRFYIGATMRF